MKLFLSVLICLLTITTFAAEPSIIPRPQKMRLTKGQFVLKSRVIIRTNKSFTNEAKYLVNFLKTGANIRGEISKSKSTKPDIVFVKTSKKLGTEGYQLKVSKRGVLISANTAAGAFYGVQSLLQLLPAEIVSTEKKAPRWTIPYVNIEDQPRFSFRSFMLDEGRYFKGMKVVKKLLDEMAILKMNTFHWHLTEDQGWRIEIKKYPKLTSIGSKRKDSQIGGWGSASRSGVPHEGFYTQKQIREIVKYAARRHITIIPEIGMPGHAQAAVAAYPELGTDAKDVEVSIVFGKMYEVYNPASERVYKMLSDILDEVCRLFPGKIIHTGGDEVRFDRWKSSKQVQEMMKKNGLKTAADVQIYFTNRMSNIIEKKGRRMMGWNEIMGDDLHGFLKGGQTASAASLSKTAVIQFWKGGQHLAMKAIEKGHDVVNSTHNYTYLDYGYGTISLEKAYSFDPIFAGLDPKFHHKVKGFGCQMWGEWIPTVANMEHMVFPRLGAYAEVGWTNLERKDFGSFNRRMLVQEKRWELRNINYAKNMVAAVTASDFFNHHKVGEWNPQNISTSYKTLEFDVSSLVKRSGTYEAVPIYTKGGKSASIQSIGLYRNGKELAIDRHDARSGTKLENVVFELPLQRYIKGGKYTVKVSIKGDGSTDSSGEIKFQKK